MESPGKVSDRQQSDFIDSFITSQVTGRGLDERTEKAYRLDLEHFYRWLRGKKDDSPGDMAEWEEKSTSIWRIYPRREDCAPPLFPENTECFDTFYPIWRGRVWFWKPYPRAGAGW